MDFVSVPLSSGRSFVLFRNQQNFNFSKMCKNKKLKINSIEKTALLRKTSCARHVMLSKNLISLQQMLTDMINWRQWMNEVLGSYCTTQIPWDKSNYELDKLTMRSTTALNIILIIWTMKFVCCLELSLKIPDFSHHRHW